MKNRRIIRKKSIVKRRNLKKKIEQKEMKLIIYLFIYFFQ